MYSFKLIVANIKRRVMNREQTEFTHLDNITAKPNSYKNLNYFPSFYAFGDTIQYLMVNPHQYN